MIVNRIDDFYVKRIKEVDGQVYEEVKLIQRNVIRPIEVTSIDTFYPDLNIKGGLCKKRCILVDNKLGEIKVKHSFEELLEMKSRQYDKKEVIGFIKYASRN